MLARLQAKTKFFLGYEVSEFSAHPPDLAALRDASTTIIPAVGRDSAGEPPHEAALALAEQWGIDAVVLPGGHGGSARTPKATHVNCGNCSPQADRAPDSFGVAGYCGRRCTTSAAE